MCVTARFVDIDPTFSCREDLESVGSRVVIKLIISIFLRQSLFFYQSRLGNGITTKDYDINTHTHSQTHMQTRVHTHTHTHTHTLKDGVNKSSPNELKT